ncbi:cytochrome c [bacterium]|nr:cytochrome c [bacterium]
MYRLLLIALIFCTGCFSKKKSKEELVKSGEQFFYSVIDHGYACYDCHTVSNADTSSRIRPGHSLLNAAGRNDYWGNRVRGRHEHLMGAALYCLVKFQKIEFEKLQKKYKDSTDGIDASDQLPAEMQSSLNEYLLSISNGRSPDLSHTMAYDAENKLSFKNYYQKILSFKPDTLKGASIYHRACAWCHGLDGEGIDGKGEALDIKPSQTLTIIEQVRQGGYRMPFFQTDIISDQELADIIAYVIALRNRSEQP